MLHEVLALMVVGKLSHVDANVEVTASLVLIHLLAVFVNMVRTRIDRARRVDGSLELLHVLVIFQ